MMVLGTGSSLLLGSSAPQLLLRHNTDYRTRDVDTGSVHCTSLLFVFLECNDTPSIGTHGTQVQTPTSLPCKRVCVQRHEE
jgi:hypothetical protein